MAVTLSDIQIIVDLNVTGQQRSKAAIGSLESSFIRLGRGVQKTSNDLLSLRNRMNTYIGTNRRATNTNKAAESQSRRNIAASRGLAAAHDKITNAVNKAQRQFIALTRSTNVIEHKSDELRNSTNELTNAYRALFAMQKGGGATSQQLAAAQHRFALASDRQAIALKNNGRAVRSGMSMWQKFSFEMDGASRAMRIIEGPLGGTAARMQTLTAVIRSNLTGWALLAGGVVAVAAVAVMLAKKLFSLNLQMERIHKSLTFATGSAELASVAFAKLVSLSSRLGFNLKSAATEFAQLAAAARGTALEGEGVEDIFNAVMEASVALSLSSDQTAGALRALQQMISKGTVQAEELRGQLGERIPGAFQQAAKAMGVTTRELGKMLEQGQVVSEEFLPKLAAEWHKAFGPSAEAAVNSSAAAVARVGNEFLLLATAFDKSVAASENVKLMLNTIAELLNFIRVAQFGEELSDILAFDLSPKELDNFITEIKTKMTDLAGSDVYGTFGQESPYQAVFTEMEAQLKRGVVDAKKLRDLYFEIRDDPNNSIILEHPLFGDVSTNRLLDLSQLDMVMKTQQSYTDQAIEDYIELGEALGFYSTAYNETLNRPPAGAARLNATLAAQKAIIGDLVDRWHELREDIDPIYEAQVEQAEYNETLKEMEANLLKVAIAEGLNIDQLKEKILQARILAGMPMVRQAATPVGLNTRLAANAQPSLNAAFYMNSVEPVETIAAQTERHATLQEKVNENAQAFFEVQQKIREATTAEAEDAVLIEALTEDILSNTQLMAIQGMIVENNLRRTAESGERFQRSIAVTPEIYKELVPLSEKLAAATDRAAVNALMQAALVKGIIPDWMIVQMAAEAIAEHSERSETSANRMQAIYDGIAARRLEQADLDEKAADAAEKLAKKKAEELEILQAQIRAQAILTRFEQRRASNPQSQTGEDYFGFDLSETLAEITGEMITPDAAFAETARQAIELHGYIEQLTKGYAEHNLTMEEAARAHQAVNTWMQEANPRWQELEDLVEKNLTPLEKYLKAMSEFEKLDPSNIQFPELPATLSDEAVFLMDMHRKVITDNMALIEDGWISTLRVMVQEMDGMFYTIPTYFEGRINSAQESFKHAIEIGLQNFPSFPSEAEANAFYDWLHKIIEVDGILAQSYAVTTEQMEAMRREAELLNPEMERFQQIETTIEGQLGNMNRELFEAAKGAKSFEDSLKSMALNAIDAIQQLIFQLLVLEPLMESLGGGSGGSKTDSIIGVISSVIGMALGSSGNIQMASGGGGGGAHFFQGGAHGLDFNVGGSGGTDSQFTPLMLTPGEHVSVKTPAQQRQEGSGEGVVINQTININTGVAQTVRAEVISMLPQIAAVSKAGVVDAKRRNKLGGGFR